MDRFSHTVWVDGKLRMDWTARVPESAGRLLHVLGKDRAGELIRVLERMRDALTIFLFNG